MVTQYGMYDFLVMSFSLCNALATFFTLMDDVLRTFLEKFVVVYLDDIIVFNKSLEEHEKHLGPVFEVLRNNWLFLNKSKCVFRHTKIPFPGHWVGQGSICMDLVKIIAIIDSEEPHIMYDVSLANYYRRFIEGYYKIATPLTDLLKKERSWNWMEKRKFAFEELKHGIVSTSVLKLPNFEKLFEVQTNASKFSIGGVLMQGLSKARKSIGL
jgi:hypothetical protein